MNLDDAYRFLNFVANREISGKTMQPREYNANLETANLELFNREYQKIRMYAKEDKMLAFQITEVGEPLRPFLIQTTVAAIPSNGRMTVPQGFVAARALRGFYSSLPKEIRIISAEHLNKLLSNPLETALTDLPACVPFKDYIHIYPNNMTNVTLLYLRRPRKPFYAYAYDSNTDLPIYVPTAEVRNYATLTMTITTVVGGEIVKLVTTETGGSGNAVTLGQITGVSGDTLSDVVYRMMAAINNNQTAHGYEAELVDVSAGTIKIYAPIGLGDTANTFTTAVTNTPGTTLEGAVTGADFSDTAEGADGSTQLEWDEIYHMEIYKLILANMGVNLSDDRLLAYQKEYQIQGV